MDSGLPAAVAGRADRAAQWAAVALGFSIPLFTALDGVLVALVLAGWLASGAWREKWEKVRGNPVVLAALGLFGLLLLGLLYGDRFPRDASFTLRKYLDLLWIAVFVWVLRDPAMRARALYALAASLGLMMAISFAFMANLLPDTGLLEGNASYAVAFKGRQTHGPLIAFAAFLYAQFALRAATSRARVLWGTLAALALVNGTMVVQGVTGYLIFATLALYLGYLARGWRGLAAALSVAAGLVAALLLTAGPFQSRVAKVQDEILRWQPGKRVAGSSIGTRLEIYRVSLAVVKERPVIGHGTGGFTKAYSRQIGREKPPRRHFNPHSEYLHVMAQLGIIGLGGLLFLFATHWRLAPALASSLESQLARALVLMMVVGCLFNSWLLDHTEGLLYAWLTGLLFAGLKPAAGDAAAQAGAGP